MNWKRDRPGRYLAGPYTVERLVTRWKVTGPGIGETHEHKDDAQAAAHDAALARIVGHELTVEPVAGDRVAIPGHGYAPGTYAAALNDLHCIRLARGRRLCLFRHEFEVVVP